MSLVARLSFIVIIILTLTGCTAATVPSDTKFKQLQDERWSFEIADNWTTLGKPWSENTIIAYGDQRGEENLASVIVYRHSAAFKAGVDSFDQKYCENYYRLSNSNDQYSDPDTNFQLGSINFTAATSEKQAECKINYSHKVNEQTTQYYERVLLVGQDLYAIEASGNDQSGAIAKYSTDSFKLITQ